MLNHALAYAALSARAQTLSGTYDFFEENESVQPTVGRAYIEEEYTPGPSNQIGVGPSGTVETFPQYHLKLSTPEGLGAAAHNTFRDALLALFPPRYALTLSDSTALRVRTSPGPMLGPMKRYKPGWLTSPVTLSLWALTQNSH